VYLTWQGAAQVDSTGQPIRMTFQEMYAKPLPTDDERKQLQAQRLENEDLRQRIYMGQRRQEKPIVPVFKQGP